MNKADVWDADRPGDAEFVRSHLDAQIALIGALIATTPNSGSKIVELKAREARLRAFVKRLQGAKPAAPAAPASPRRRGDPTA
jgi:hypothetical protein